MIVSEGFAGRKQAVIDVFIAAFTASDGVGEGAAIGGLVLSIMDKTPPEDVRFFVAEDDGEVIGAVAFSRLRYPEDRQSAFLLSPMAVAPSRQRQGVGQALLTEALATLRSVNIAVVVTYGDPDYYGRIGFVPITVEDVQAPQPLSMPHGWLGQRLDGEGRPKLQGPSTCVAAFDRADIW